MSFYFLDSSALVKRYVKEQGSSWVKSLTTNSQNTIILAHITPVEIVSSLARKQRESIISQSRLGSLVLLIERHFVREYITIHLTDDILNLSKQLLLKYPLRAADAIQLASAKQHNNNLIQHNLSTLTFVCADIRLLNVAQSEGLAVDNPNQYP